MKIKNVLFPACAGVIPLPGFKWHDSDTFPRMRGGDPSYSQYSIDKGDFSPHARG